MKKDIKADPNTINPIPNIDFVVNVKPTIKNKNIIVGDFTYFSDINFESHVTHQYEFNDVKLIIGKFTQIAKDVEFIMNGANHQMNAITTFPFYIFAGLQQDTPSKETMNLKGDTIIGNDVWIGQNATIMPGVNIGSGAIIGANSVVASNVKPYTIVVRNPAKLIKQRFDDEFINLLLDLSWWDLPINKINDKIPLLTNSNIVYAKKEIKKLTKLKGD